MVVRAAQAGARHGRRRAAHPAVHAARRGLADLHRPARAERRGGQFGGLWEGGRQEGRRGEI